MGIRKVQSKVARSYFTYHAGEGGYALYYFGKKVASVGGLSEEELRFPAAPGEMRLPAIKPCNPASNISRTSVWEAVAGIYPSATSQFASLALRAIDEIRAGRLEEKTREKMREIFLAH